MPHNQGEGKQGAGEGMQNAAAWINAGVSRCDITPPVGIYSRMWGAAEQDLAEGVHRPLTATVLALVPPSEPALMLVSLDWVMTLDSEVMERLRAPLEGMCGGDASRVIVSHTHTHGVGLMGASRRDLPGGQLIEPYLERVCDQVSEAAVAAVDQADSSPCTLTWSSGRCGLAANRDLPDPAPGTDRYVCGFNPEGDADDAVLVGRITRDDNGDLLATVVNYACHPTTLAWENKLLSPDFVGAMRELVEAQSSGICLFLQGASGELAPAYQYTGDHALADSHGRQLGYAVLGVLESMLPPGQRLVFEEIVESGAPLAVWRPRPFVPSDRCAALLCSADLPLKPMPALEEVQAQLDGCSERHAQERLRRKLRVIADVDVAGLDGRYPQPVTIWRLGSILFVATAGEPYSLFQQQLRCRFSDYSVVVMGVANHGLAGYLVPPELCHLDLYQAWQSPFADQALPILLDTCRQQISQLLSSAEP